MNSYELTLVFKPELDEKQTDAIIDALGVEVTGKTQWGKRLLAYPIEKHREGVYIHTEVNVPSADLQKLDQTLNLHEDIIRHLLVKAE